MTTNIVDNTGKRNIHCYAVDTTKRAIYKYTFSPLSHKTETTWKAICVDTVEVFGSSFHPLLSIKSFLPFYFCMLLMFFPW